MKFEGQPLKKWRVFRDLYELGTRETLVFQIRKQLTISVEINVDATTCVDIGLCSIFSAKVDLLWLLLHVCLLFAGPRK